MSVRTFRWCSRLGRIKFLLAGLLAVLAACTAVQPPFATLEPAAASGECMADADCVPASCCHATSCVPKSKAPTCEGVFCTQECRPGTIDCGGGCACEQNRCVARLI